MNRRFLMIAAIAISTPLIASAQMTIYVDDDAPNDVGPNNPNLSDPLEDGTIDHPFDRINEAIDAASNGDTVLVRAGTYLDAETINTDGKAITIRGEDGAANTIVDGFASPQSIMVIDSGEGSGTVIEGLTLQGGDDTTGGALQIVGTTTSPVIRDCVFRFNTTTFDGSAVHVTAPSPSTNARARFEDCIFENNTATGQAVSGNIDATFFASRVNTTLVRCIFRNNTALAGAGIGINLCPGATVLDCEFETNDNGRDGTVYVASSSNVEIRGSVFTRNTGNGGPAVYVENSTVLISRCELLGNTSGNLGGAMLLDSCDVTMTNSVMVGNTALNDGGAVAIRDNGSCFFENCTITANFAADAIGGVFPVGAGNLAMLLNTILINNTSGTASTTTNFGGTSNASVYATSYSIVPTADLPAGADVGDGNFVADPMFVSAPDPGMDGTWGTMDDDYGDVRLMSSISPAIDAGDSVHYTGPLADLGGADRAQDDPDVLDTGLAIATPTIDIGAYEVQAGGPAPSCVGDFNSDGLINGADLATLLSVWGMCP